MNFGFAIFDFGSRRGRIPKTIWIGSSSGPNRKSKIQNRKLAGIVALAVTFAMCEAAAHAQQPKVARVGFLNAASLSAILIRIEAFRQGMRELGYVEGKSIVIEYRAAEGKLDRLRELVTELVRLKVEVIVTAGPSATRSAQKATSAIPIVMAFDYDPVGSGAIANLAHPGANITGLSALYLEMMENDWSC